MGALQEALGLQVGLAVAFGQPWEPAGRPLAVPQAAEVALWALAWEGLHLHNTLVSVAWHAPWLLKCVHCAMIGLHVLLRAVACAASRRLQSGKLSEAWQGSHARQLGAAR